MQHLSASLIVMIGVWTVLQANDELRLAEKEQIFQRKICQIIHNTNAQVILVYNSRSVTKANTLEIMGNDNVFDIYHCLLQQPTIVRDLQNFEMEPLRFSSTINLFYINSLPAMRKVVASLNPQQHCKHAHKYIFIWTLPDTTELESFFKALWQNNILFAIASVIKQQQIYTFEPFTAQGFQLKVVHKEPYFYDKLGNLQHYELRISMFKDNVRAVPRPDHSRKGYNKIDGMVAATVVERVNATARYITPQGNESYGSLINGSFTGSLRDIHSGLAHIGFNYRFVLDDIKPYFEELYPYRRRILYLVIPAGKMRPQYLIFSSAFSYGLWCLLMLNFCLLLCLFIALRKRVKRLPNYFAQSCRKNRRWYDIVEVFAKAHMGEPLQDISNASSIRLFMITWILFSYLLNRIYFAKLESSFVHPSYEPELNTLEDLNKLNVPIYAFPDIFKAVELSLDTKYYEIINRLGIRITSNINADDFTLAQVKKLRNVGMILNDAMAKELVALTFNDATNRPILHIVKEYLRSFTSSYVVTKGSPFLYKFQQIVTSFYELGFINYWLEEDARQNNFLHRSKEFRQDVETDFDLNESNEVGSAVASVSKKKKVVLNMNILEGAFYLWIGGICASCCGFAIELIYCWHQTRRTKIFI